MKMQMIMKSLFVGALVMGVSVCFGGLLLEDTFDTANSHDITADLAGRQSGTEATATWSDTASNDWTTQIDGGTLRLYENSSSAASVSARLDKDFATVANDVNIAVSVHTVQPANGFIMVNFGMAAADGFSGNAGYSFRLDARNAAAVSLSFYDNGTLQGWMDVTSIATGVGENLSMDFAGGNTVSATFNGTAFAFNSGASYTGTSETENHVVMGWFGDGTGVQLTSAQFDGVAVTSIPEPSTLALIGIVSAGLFGFRRMKI